MGTLDSTQVLEFGVGGEVFSESKIDRFLLFFHCFLYSYYGEAIQSFKFPYLNLM